MVSFLNIEEHKIKNPFLLDLTWNNIQDFGVVREWMIK